jgi:glycosyltransferase involved in cell wall biosynthesis
MGDPRLPLRVCIVRFGFYPSELPLKREAEYLVLKGYDVSVICLRGQGDQPEEVIDGVDVHRIPARHIRGKILAYLIEYNRFFALAAWKLLRLHLKKRFAVVQVSTMPDYLVFAALIPKLTGSKIILHLHEPMPELFRTLFSKPLQIVFLPLVKLAERLAVRFADRVLTVTHQMRDRLVSRGADREKITVILNVPDERAFADALAANSGDNGSASSPDRRHRFTVITHGAIEQRYGHETLVRAVGLLHGRIPVELHILGSGSYIESVLELAWKLGVEDRVHYFGYVNFEEMVARLCSANAAIVPMERNPYSELVHTNKMYEYIHLRRPLIASRLHALTAYFPPDTIVYFEPDDPEDLAEKIEFVYHNADEVRRRVGRTSEIYERLQWRHQREKYVGVYQRLLQGTVQNPQHPAQPKGTKTVAALAKKECEEIEIG